MFVIETVSSTRKITISLSKVKSQKIFAWSIHFEDLTLVCNACMPSESARSARLNNWINNSLCISTLPPPFLDLPTSPFIFPTVP